jgi:phenylacetate-CoA ligase
MMSAFESFWYLLQLKRNQWLNRDQLRELQDRGLRAIVKHAYDNVEFYHRRFDSLGIKPGDIRSVDDLSKLPLTTRQDVRQNFPEKIVAKGTDLASCYKKKTSGTTSIPVELVFNRDDEAFRLALFYRALSECGYRVTDKLLTVYHVDDEKKRRFQGLGLLRQKNIYPTTPIENYLETVRNYRPDVIYSYVTVLHMLAQKIRRERVNEVRPRLVFTHAEELDSRARSTIEDVFQTEVFNTYGSTEFIRLGWECTCHAGYHLDADAFIIEFLKDGENVSPGESGQIVVTALHSYAMPLIRYPVGDFGVPSDEICPCGRGLPIMKSVDGRMDDILTSPTGQSVSPMSLIGVMEDEIDLYDFRMVQEASDVLRVEVSEEESVSEGESARIIDRIHRLYNGEMKAYIAKVDHIPLEKSGKLKRFVPYPHA